MTKIKRDTPITLEIECIKCDQIKSIPQAFIHRTNVCIDCRNKIQRGYQEKYRMLKKGREGRGIGGRIEYPLGNWLNQKHKFNTLKRELESIDDRGEWQTVIKSRLDALMQNSEVYNWILNHKSDIVEYGEGKNVPKNSRRGPQTMKLIPDTRDAEL